MPPTVTKRTGMTSLDEHDRQRLSGSGSEQPGSGPTTVEEPLVRLGHYSKRFRVLDHIGGPPPGSKRLVMFVPRLTVIFATERFLQASIRRCMRSRCRR